jgi:putative membrane protein
MWFDGWWMALWMLLFWAGMILVVIWAVRAFTGEGRGFGSTGRVGQRNALQILEERFARGEIDRDEFEERRSALQGP